MLCRVLLSGPTFCVFFFLGKPLYKFKPLALLGIILTQKMLLLLPIQRKKKNEDATTQSHSSPYFPKSSSQSHDLCSSPILLVIDLCLPIVDLCFFVVDLCSSSSTFALRPQRPSSSSPQSLRFDLSISSLRFGYLWNCCLLLFLFFWFVDLFFGFVDLLILFLRNQTSVFDLCISVEIKAHRRPPEPDPTRPVAFRGRRRVWDFSSGRFIPLPPFVPCFYSLPLFIVILFFRILISVIFTKFLLLLLLRAFLSFLRLFLICLTLSKPFFFFFFLRRPLLLFLSQGVQCNSKYLYSLLLAQERQFVGSLFLVWHLLKLRTCTFWVLWSHNLYMLVREIVILLFCYCY